MTEPRVVSIEDALKAMLWHYRLQEPGMFVKVTQDAEKALSDCCAYLKVKPTITIVERSGCYIVALTDEQGNAIVPIENTQEAFDAGQDAVKVRLMREEAEFLANRVKNSAAVGEFSSSAIMELADIAIALAK